MTRVLTRPSSSFVGDVDSQLYVFNDVLYCRRETEHKALQKSTDGGATWTDIYKFPFDITQSITVLNNGNILVHVKETGNYSNDPPGSLYLSTNGGATFEIVLTAVNGGFATWSVDYRNGAVIAAEYGKYPASRIYKSVDYGRTWSKIFTHPNPTNAMHWHAVHIDRHNDNWYYAAAGDSTEVRGVWISTDAGKNWTKSNGLSQATWIETTPNYAIFMGDSSGKIYRMSKESIANGTYNLETVLDTTNEVRVDIAPTSFYGGTVDAQGRVWAGGLSYGENTPTNNKDTALYVSWDEGASWRPVYEYLRKATASSGCGYVSKPTSDGKVYLTINNKSTIGKAEIEILDTTDPAIDDLYKTDVSLSGTITLR